MIVATIATIALILMIAGLALKPRNATLLLASTIPWIIFAFLMFSYTFTNTAINTALLMFGGFMALLSAFLALDVYMSRRPTRLKAEGEQEAYKKQVLRVTRRR